MIKIRTGAALILMLGISGVAYSKDVPASSAAQAVSVAPVASGLPPASAVVVEAISPSAASAAASNGSKDAAPEPRATPASDGSNVTADKIYTMVVSTLALLLSGSLAIYTLSKDQRARKQSISDDYWLRKVISPLAIEPLIKVMLETISKVPADCCERMFDPEELGKFMEKYQQDHRVQSTNLMALGLLSQKLYQSASEAFDEVEDAVITYCNSNRLSAKTSAGHPVESRERLAETIRVKLNEVLQLVRGYQSTLK